MKITVVGGGPAGLYFSILMKKAQPDVEITVYERNRPDDTFGFGVVFSDETLAEFESYDRESYKLITDEFAYWDDIEIHYQDTVRRIGGNGFCGCSRKNLLLLMHQRCRALGIELNFEADIQTVDDIPPADLIIASDGINSMIRETYRDHFNPSVDWRPNKFSWMGSTRPLDAFNFFFRKTEFGIMVAHTYQYEPNASTWIFEMAPETWEKACFEHMSERESADLLEKIFADDLQGHPLLINRSMWRNFPAILCERWTKDNIVLLGDAKSTAHFSIGSGTKQAMEDAIALYESVMRTDTIDAALADFETTRREDVEKLLHSANVSLVWFEHMDRFWDVHPDRFTMGLMSRAKAITYDNLELRAPEFIKDLNTAFAKDLNALYGFDVATENATVPMFQPFRIGEMVVENRVVVSPMCMYSAEDGKPTEFHLVHYGSRGIGGAGLMFTEMTCVAPEARITPGCTGMWNDEQQDAWSRIVDFVHEQSTAKFCMQLGHAGRKGSTKLIWDGMDEPLESGGWDILSASDLPYMEGSPVPHIATRDDMDRIRDQFVASARRADAAGFDMLELHCAHGYLLASFISPLTNRRNDEYGGSLENRLRFPLEVFEALRTEWPSEKPMSVRLSATDWKEGGITGDDTVEIAKAFEQVGCNLIDVSAGQTVPDDNPVYGRMFQTPFADQVRNEASLATMCVGNITTADQVNTIIAAGRSDLVALARPHLWHPHFTVEAAAHYGFDLVASPRQYMSGKEQAFRLAERDREEMRELRIKARPQHAYLREQDAAE